MSSSIQFRKFEINKETRRLASLLAKTEAYLHLNLFPKIGNYVKFSSPLLMYTLMSKIKQNDLVSSCYNKTLNTFLGRPRELGVSSATSFANPSFKS